MSSFLQTTQATTVATAGLVTTLNVISNQLGVNKYTIEGINHAITSCIYNGNTYTLGSFITQGDASSSGILKSILDCTAWANLMIDHYFTTTGLTSGCGVFIPSELAYITCLGATGISMETV